MRVLVAYATQYGSTREIATRIGGVLADNRIDASLRAVDDALEIDGFNAFVIGSAVHAGHWLRPAVEFVRNHEPVLAKHPVWLFSSGPIGDAAFKPQSDPKDVAVIRSEMAVQGHAVFGGSFHRGSTIYSGWLDRTVGRFIPEGDYRDWAEIETWARDIARQLKTREPVLTR